MNLTITSVISKHDDAEPIRGAVTNLVIIPVHSNPALFTATSKIPGLRGSNQALCNILVFIL